MTLWLRNDSSILICTNTNLNLVFTFPMFLVSNLNPREQAKEHWVIFSPLDSFTSTAPSSSNFPLIKTYENLRSFVLKTFYFHNCFNGLRHLSKASAIQLGHLLRPQCQDWNWHCGLNKYQNWFLVEKFTFSFVSNCILWVTTCGEIGSSKRKMLYFSFLPSSS